MILKADTPEGASASLASPLYGGMGTGRNNGDGVGEGVGEGVCRPAFRDGGGGGGARFTKTLRSDDEEDVRRCPKLCPCPDNVGLETFRTAPGLVDVETTRCSEGRRLCR